MLLYGDSCLPHCLCDGCLSLFLLFQTIENDCIQDLMFHGIHLPKRSPVHSKVREVREAPLVYQLWAVPVEILFQPFYLGIIVLTNFKNSWFHPHQRSFLESWYLVSPARTLCFNSMASELCFTLSCLKSFCEVRTSIPKHDNTVLKKKNPDHQWNS